MKVTIWTTLVLLLGVAISQCFASTSELKALLRALEEVEAESNQGSFKPIPTDPNKQLTKKHSDPEACGKYAALKEDNYGHIDFPEGNNEYSGLSNCGWAIVGGINSKVTVTFTFMDIEHDKPCDDFIALYAIKTNRNGEYDIHPINPITSKMCPKALKDMPQKTFTTRSGEEGIYVHFISDWRDNEKGFELDYKVEFFTNQGPRVLLPGPAPPPGVPGNNIPAPAVPSGSGTNDIDGLTCDFDRGSLCGWQNVNTDTLDWKVQKGSDSPWKTWGKVDHTTGQRSGAYAYLYTNDTRRRQGGVLSSPTLSAGPSGGRCLTFYYNMQTDGTFKVNMDYSDGTSQTVLQRDGSQGNGWLKATISLISTKPYMIRLEHDRGSVSVETGLAIDDVQLTDRACPSRLNSCGTNIYGSRKRRDLQSLLQALLHIDDKDDEKLDRRISGGQPSKKGQFPWIVHIRIFTDGVDSGRDSQCGGSIIDNQWILTAAHCFESDGYTMNDPEKVRIYLGEHNTHYEEVEESQFVIIPEQIIIHPDRNQNARGINGYRYDVTLIKLKYRLTFTDDVNAVCLPTSEFRSGTRCIAAGWGLAPSGFGWDTSNNLLHLDKVIQSDYECHLFDITTDMICAIAPSGTGDVCQGDSGGPLVCQRGNKYELAGVVSFGEDCASRRRTSGVYADIMYFMPWIKSTIS